MDYDYVLVAVKVSRFYAAVKLQEISSLVT
jgi:hypothetical protein